MKKWRWWKKIIRLIMIMEIVMIAEYWQIFFPNRLAYYLEMICLRKLRFDDNCYDGSNYVCHWQHIFINRNKLHSYKKILSTGVCAQDPYGYPESYGLVTHNMSSITTLKMVRSTVLQKCREWLSVEEQKHSYLLQFQQCSSGK